MSSFKKYYAKNYKKLVRFERDKHTKKIDPFPSKKYKPLFKYQYMMWLDRIELGMKPLMYTEKFFKGMTFRDFKDLWLNHRDIADDLIKGINRGYYDKYNKEYA